MKPTIYKVAPFDAKLGTTINIKWVGRQQKANKIVIEDNDTSSEVYSATYDSYKGAHLIPASGNGLTNGKTYKFKIAVIDMDGLESEWSDYSTFKCFTTPAFGFKDVTSGKVITNAGLDLNISYTQAEGELLNKWTAYLYDSTKIQMDTAGEKYYATTTACNFSGLSDETTYYIRALGETVNGMAVDSGFIQITVNLAYYSNFLNFEVKNNANGGNIHVISKAVSITGQPDKDPEYVTDDEGNTFADLRDNVVSFNEGFELVKDFTMYMKLKRATIGTPVVTMTAPGSNDNLTIYLNSETAGTYYATLVCTINGGKVTVKSNVLSNVSLTSIQTVLDGDWLLNGEADLSGNNISVNNHLMGIAIQRKSNVYSIALKLIS